MDDDDDDEGVRLGCMALGALLQFDCCPSCHDDYDDGWDQPVDVEFEGKTYWTCCAGYRAVNENASRAKAPAS